MKCTMGDLAYIINAIRPENIGLVVECKESIGYHLRGDIVDLMGERYIAIDSDNYWIISSPTGDITTQYGLSKISFIPDTWLEPIVPKKLDTDTTKTLELDDLLST